MKVGILTFHCAHNYGAVLQSYALQETIKLLGHEVDIIDYQPKYLTEPYRPFSLRYIFSGNIKYIIYKFITSIITYPNSLKRRRVFNDFIDDNFQLSNVTFDVIPDYYDLYIIGSDQIWNTKITNGFDHAFWGFFKTINNSKKITYAASIGGGLNTKSDIPFLENALENFEGISLRENEYLEFIQSIYKNKVFKVLDPTFILDESIWNLCAIKPNISDKYVLVYQVKSSLDTIRIAEDVAKQVQGVVVEIPAYLTIKNLMDKNNATSPFEFLGWIKFATCIVTTSFHGTAFSLIFKKDFYSIDLANGIEKRSIDLLDSLKLSERLISRDSNLVYEKINYDSSTQEYNQLRQKSIDYLKMYLG